MLWINRVLLICIHISLIVICRWPILIYRWLMLICRWTFNNNYLREPIVIEYWPILIYSRLIPKCKSITVQHHMSLSCLTTKFTISTNVSYDKSHETTISFVLPLTYWPPMPGCSSYRPLYKINSLVCSVVLSIHNYIPTISISQMHN